MEILENGVYTYKEVQEILGVRKTTLSRSIKKGELKPLLFGNKYRFLGSELLRFVRSKSI